MKVLGIDPGSGIIGFGLVKNSKSGPKMVDAGVIKTTIGEDTSKRLLELYESMKEIIEETNK